MTTLPDPDERIAELLRVLTETADELHYRHWLSDRSLTTDRQECGVPVCREATAALAGDYVKDGGR